MLRRCPFVVCVLSAFSLAGIAPATIYHVTTLAPVGTDTGCYGFGLATVGGVLEAVGRDNPLSPVIWTGGTPSSLLPSIPSATGGWAKGINTGGAVVGYATVSSVSRPFYLPNGGTASILPVLNDADPYGTANGINAVGQIAGTSKSTDMSDGYHNNHAAVWTYSAGAWGVTELPVFSGAVGYQGGLSIATAINAGGQVVGYSYQPPGQVSDAAMWSYDGLAWTIRNLNPLHSVCVGSTNAYAVNDSGDAVGYGWTQGGISLTRDAFLFKHDGTVVKLGSLANPSSGVPEGYGYGINNYGVVVGYSQASLAAGGGYHATISDGTENSVQDLNTMIAPDGSGAGWVLQRAQAIDDAGHIVGYGTITGGFARAFLLMPVLPGDTDQNGGVDINDLSKVLTNYNKTGTTWADGNFDGTGTITTSDLSAVLTNYGKNIGAGAGIKAVPEPATPMLLASVLAGWLIRVRCRRK